MYMYIHPQTRETQQSVTKRLPCRAMKARGVYYRAFHSENSAICLVRRLRQPCGAWGGDVNIMAHVVSTKE